MPCRTGVAEILVSQVMAAVDVFLERAVYRVHVSGKCALYLIIRLP